MEGLRSKPVKKKPSCSSGQGSRPGPPGASSAGSTTHSYTPAPTNTMLGLGDDKTVVKPKKPTRATNNKSHSAGQELSDEQLRDVAQTLGPGWEQAAKCLGLTTKDLDEIKEENKVEYMQRQNMLRLWKRRNPGKATAQDLLRGLEGMKDLPVETRQLLKGQELSDKQLQAVAQTLGPRWEQAAKCLWLSTKDLDEIKEENKVEYMQRRNMLRLWKRRNSGKATAQDLLRGLEGLKDLPDETRQLLKGQELSDKQLRDVAQTLGPKWEQAAICLGLTTKDLDEIKKEKKEFMQRRNMLLLWKRRNPGKATAQDLLRGLVGMEDLPVETRLSLQDLISEMENDSSGSLTEDTASMPVVDRRKDEEGSDAENDEDDKEEMQFKSQPEKLKAAQQSPEYKKVTPTKISKWSFEVQLEGEGTYECSATGLVFEVTEKALVRYSVLSWSNFSSSVQLLKDSWRPAGSIYDVDVDNEDSSVLKFIHFPHSLCLAEPEHELSFSVLLVKGRRDVIESTVDFTARHVKWRVSSLSQVGPIIQSSLQVKHNGPVLVYKELKRKYQTDLIFRVFLASNSDSEIKAVEEQVLTGVKKWIKIDIRHCCLLEEKFYHLTSEPEGQIEPKKLKFTTAVLASKDYFVARFSEGPPFTLFLKDSDCDEPLWSATLNEEDWNDETTNTRLRVNLQNIRLDFVQKVSIPVIKGLLDDLWQQKVFNTEEKDFVIQKNQKIKTDMARCLIDSVIDKGETASQILIDCLKKRDKFLSDDLKRISSPAVGGAEL